MFSIKAQRIRKLDSQDTYSSTTHMKEKYCPKLKKLNENTFIIKRLLHTSPSYTFQALGYNAWNVDLSSFRSQTQDSNPDAKVSLLIHMNSIFLSCVKLKWNIAPLTKAPIKINKAYKWCNKISTAYRIFFWTNTLWRYHKFTYIKISGFLGESTEKYFSPFERDTKT